MTVMNIQLPTLNPEEQGKALEGVPRLSALSGVPATLTVVAGQARSTVGEVLNLREGMLLSTSTPLNAPFDICLGETVIARGELVAVGEHFGIRVTEIAPQAGKA